MSSLKESTSRKMPSTRIPARPAKPSARERELLTQAGAEIRAAVRAVAAVRRSLCGVAKELCSFEPSAYVVALRPSDPTELPWTEIGIRADQLGDCAQLLAEALCSLRDVSAQSPHKLIAELVEDDRRFAERAAARAEAPAREARA